MLIRLLAVLTLLLTGAGCATGVTVATAASVASLAGSTLDTGTDVYSMGKLNTAEMASIPDVVEASRLAAKDLKLTIMTDKQRGDGVVRMAMVDNRHKVVDLWLDPRTPNLTRIEIDVGWFGSQPTATLILSRLRMHLNEIQAGSTTRPATTRKALSFRATHPDVGMTGSTSLQ